MRTTAGLNGLRQYGPTPGDHDVFAVTCFYVDREARGTGVASALLDAAIDHARQQGAVALDAFPKTNLAPHAQASRRAEENDSWMGRRASYEARGFVTIAGSRRGRNRRCAVAVGLADVRGGCGGASSGKPDLADGSLCGAQPDSDPDGAGGGRTGRGTSWPARGAVRGLVRPTRSGVGRLRAARPRRPGRVRSETGH
ncbi:GNAT family N-acetyltransferase [Kribbella sp. NBC_01484]|uniref:GNAT family N-acetyltransferase n=1 Tax=Kribbella sp. NBC_01484 TaxID=2903579 RepID=UPI003FA60F69